MTHPSTVEALPATPAWFTRWPGEVYLRERNRMRAIFLILILAVVVLIGLVASGLVDVSQIRGAKPPTVQAGGGTIRTQPGQTPAFRVETGSVTVGTRPENVVAEVGPARGQTTVPVPTVKLNRPAEAEANKAQ